MLAILWLIVWATVAEAFYDDYNWYTSDDGVNNERVFDSQRLVRDNFTDSLRSFVESYVTREGDEELTMAKAKQRLRSLKIYKYTGSSRDFEPSRELVLPLQEGGKYCTMGRHTKVGCNLCTCVAGQLYMCTGMICPHTQGKPQTQERCKEGNKRKVDSCNYCFCRNGHEICSTKDCRQVHAYVRSRYTCREGARRNKDCNRCLCLNGEDFCTTRICNKKTLSETSPNIKTFSETGSKIITLPPPSSVPDHTRNIPAMFRGPCDYGMVIEAKCRFSCKCKDKRWSCSKLSCDSRKKPGMVHKAKCKEGTTRFKDACNRCYCRAGRELCEQKDCDEEENQQFYHYLRNGEGQCVEGSYHKIDSCNYCLCLNGNKMCTRKPCPVYDLESLSATKCTKGSMRQVDPCNYCTCKDGVYVCTNNPCVERSTNSMRSEKCERGGIKTVKCNRCICIGGRWVCTQSRCIGNVKESRIKKIKTREGSNNNDTFSLRYSLDHECEVGLIIQRPDDCNYCRCTYRRKWKCTENVCPYNNEYHNFFRKKAEPCIDGSRRQVNACNYCVCHSGAEFCTQKPCWSTRRSMIFSEPECLVGEPVPAADPCNLCICLNSDILCTNNPCIQRQIAKNKAKCVKGQKYSLPDGCNFCVCHGDREFCTVRGCLIPEKVQSLKTCKEGSVHPARDGCNICVCMKGQMTCTHKDCPEMVLRNGKSLLSYIRTRNMNAKKHKMMQATKEKCTPGRKYVPRDFDPNCPNECICDRHELLCTNRKCFNNWDKNTPFNWPVGRVEISNRNAKNLLSQEKACEEYEPLPSDDICNSCMCLNERKVCTVTKCGEDIGNGDPDDDALIQKIKESHGVKTKKTKNTFCEPFTFFSPNSNRFCRNCFCLLNGLALCLLNLCKYSKDIPHQNSPEELDEICTPGEIGYPTKCVSCTCSKTAKWICTREELALCQERDCDVKDEFHMGFAPYCAGCKCSVKEWFCSIQSESCKDYSNVTCPQGTFIYNPKQHCSICLCGGNEEGSHNMCFTEAKCVRQVSSKTKV